MEKTLRKALLKDRLSAIRGLENRFADYDKKEAVNFAKKNGLLNYSHILFGASPAKNIQHFPVPQPWQARIKQALAQKADSFALPLFKFSETDKIKLGLRGGNSSWHAPTDGEQGICQEFIDCVKNWANKRGISMEDKFVISPEKSEQKHVVFACAPEAEGLKVHAPNFGEQKPIHYSEYTEYDTVSTLEKASE